MSPQWAVESIESGALNMTHHEAALQPVLESLLPEGGVLVDVGANMGMWTCRLGHRASKVIAVEPNPVTVDVLRQNIALNHLANVEVLQVAAWDCDEPLDFLNPAPAEPMAGLMRVVPGEAGAGPLRGVRLDDALPPLDRLDLVKVDTEGADIRALAGMTETIARHKPRLFIESHHLPPYEYYTLDDLTSFIESIGYVHEQVGWMSQYHLKCWPRGSGRP